MAFCKTCGKEVHGNARVCKSCGCLVNTTVNSNSNDSNIKFKVAGVCQIVLGVIGFGRLILLDIGRFFFHLITSFLGYILINIASLDSMLELNGELDILLNLDANYDLLKYIGYGIIIFNVVINVFDGILLLRRTKDMKPSCLLGCLGTVGTFILSLVAIVGACFYIVDYNFFMEMFDTTKEMIPVDEDEHLKDYIVSVEGNTITVSFEVKEDVLFIMLFAHDKNDISEDVETINALGMKTYKYLTPNNKYTHTFTIDSSIDMNDVVINYLGSISKDKAVEAPVLYLVGNEDEDYIFTN